MKKSMDIASMSGKSLKMPQIHRTSNWEEKTGHKIRESEDKLESMKTNWN